MALRPEIIDQHRRRREDQRHQPVLELPLMPPEPMYPQMDQSIDDDEQSHGHVIVIDLA